MNCEKCQEPIEHKVKFKATDGNMPIGARQRYTVVKALCTSCAEVYKVSQIPNKIYMVTVN